MSGSDQGDDASGFLARWSQRKQEARQPEPKPDAPEATVTSGPDTGADPAEEFDLASLPRLEDLTGTTDITSFLRKGVPEHLRNEALRKSWALDPAVRNYVNPALEYAYDWNTPGGVPGTGELGAGIDVARLVSQIMGDGPAEPPASEVNPANAAANIQTSLSERKHDVSQIPEPELPTQAQRRSGEAVSASEDASEAKDGHTDAAQVPQSQAGSPAAPQQQAVRRHGSAKPTI